MPMNTTYTTAEPARDTLDATPGATLVEFGTGWCGFCQAAQAPLAEAMKAHPGLRHLKIEDGPGRRLGRSFKVKLWPTLIVMKDGVEMGRVVRPSGAKQIAELLAAAGQGAD